MPKRVKRHGKNQRRHDDRGILIYLSYRTIYSLQDHKEEAKLRNWNAASGTWTNFRRPTSPVTQLSGYYPLDVRVRGFEILHFAHVKLMPMTIQQDEKHSLY